MISWIQNTFQHHFRIIFAILLGVTIISFVAITGASNGFGKGNGRKTLQQPFFDLNLSSKEDGQRLSKDAELEVQLTYGSMPFRSQEQFTNYALARYAGLYLAKQLNVPAPSQNELVEHIKTLRVFAGADGQFDAKRYDEFRKNIKKSGQVSEADITRVLSDSVRIQRVQKLVAGPGYVLPADIKRELITADTSWTLEVATIDRASFTPAIVPTELELTNYFAAYGEKFGIPPQVKLSAIEFAATTYISAVSINETDVKAFYDANPSRFPKPATAPTDAKLPASPEADFAAVRTQVEQTLRFEIAAKQATKVASEFAYALFENKIAPNTEKFDAYLAKYKVSVKDVPAFSADNVPSVLGANPEISEEAFKLTATRPISDAIRTERGSVVLVWQNSIAARKPELAEVRSQVSTDFVENEKSKRFSELGQTLRTQVQAKITAGASFETAINAAAATAGVKVTTKTLPAFTLRQPPKDFDQSVASVLSNLNQGEISAMASNGENAAIVFAKEKKLPDTSETSSQYAQMSARIAQVTAASDARDFFRELVNQELAKAEAAR